MTQAAAGTMSNNKMTTERAQTRVLVVDDEESQRTALAAMIALWSMDNPEYHGRFVNFGPMWSWPKPLQTPRPPVLLLNPPQRAQRFENRIKHPAPLTSEVHNECLTQVRLKS